VTALTNDEKTYLRSNHPHQVELRLSVLVPDILFTGKVNMATPDRGARAITYDGDSGEGDVVAGQTLWVGDSAGAHDVGKLRVRSINPTTNVLTVSENALVWQDDQHLTVKENYELWPVFPRFTAAGDFYKDYDVAYSDQNAQPPPVAIAGPPRAGILSGGSLAFNIDASQSYAIVDGCSITDYLWSATGGNIGSPTLAATGISFTTAGTYWLKLEVTDNNGKSQSTYRPLFVHDATGANAPFTKFNVRMLAGDWERGGWTAQLQVFDDCTASDFPDGTLVLLWQDAHYGTHDVDIGGYKVNQADARNILFAGYVRGETVRQNWDTGAVEFEATTIEGLLKRHMMFSVPLKMIYGSQDQWYEYTNPTVAKAVHHFWRWHSTLFSIADVFLPTSNTLKMRTIEDFCRGTLYGQVDTFARQHGIFAHVCCNKYGQLYLEEDIQLLNDTDREAKTTVSEIAATDRRGEIVISHRPEARVAMVKLSGMSYDGATLAAIGSRAPGDVPGDVGATVMDVERQVLDDQAQANLLAGRLLWTANNEYPDVRIGFAGHYLGALDLVPQEWWTLTIAAGDTERGITWTDKKLVARHIKATFDHANGVLLPDCVFEPEVTAASGIANTGGEDDDYPVTPPSDPNPPPVPPDPVEPPASSGRLMAFDKNLGCYNQTISQGWEERNTGDGTSDNQGGYDPHWQATQDSTNIEDAIMWRVQDGKIYRSTDCAQSWTEVTGMGNPPNDWSDDPAPALADVEFVVRTDNVYTSGEHYFLARWQNDADAWRSWVLKCTGNGDSWTWGADWTTISSIELVTNGTFDADISGWWDDAPGNPPDACSWDAGRMKMVFRALSDTYANQYITAPINATYDVSADFTRGAYTGTVSLKVDGGIVLNWGTTLTGVKSGTVGLSAAQHTLQIVTAFGGEDRWWDNITIPYGEGLPISMYPIWMDTDTASGQYLYLTAWVDGDLSLIKILTSTLAPVSTTSLGSATIDQVVAGTYTAYPRVKEFIANEVYVYGQIPSPASQIAKSTNGGASFSAIENGWGGDNCGAFMIDEDGTMSAVRNGATPSFYRGIGTLALQAASMGLAADVPPDAFTKLPGRMAVGAASIVVETDDNGKTWADLSYPSGGDLRSLVYV